MIEKDNSKMKNDLKRKKLLILGGAFQHEKLVEAARELGVYTVVADYVEESSAKKIADKSYNIDIYDIDSLLKVCFDERIEGVISTSLDPCQKSYVELCERGGYFCYGSKKQFHIMTNKILFKKMCIENNVDVIPSFGVEGDEINQIHNYPIIVKPVDGRGSRGQTICYSASELNLAIDRAKRVSLSSEILIEKYIENGSFFQVTYFCINGTPYLIRTADGYCGSKSYGLERVVSCSISPSKYTTLFLKTVHRAVIRMINNLGIVNGPFFMQGIVSNNKFFFFDPGLRFPGVDYERIYKKVFKKDLMKAMVELSLNGNCSKSYVQEDSVWLTGKKAAILFPFISAGVIGKAFNEEKIVEDSCVISYLPRYKKGDKVSWSDDVTQRYSEIDILADNLKELKDKINEIISLLQVKDINGNEMICDKMDTSIIE